MKTCEEELEEINSNIDALLEDVKNRKVYVDDDLSLSLIKNIIKLSKIIPKMSFDNEIKLTDTLDYLNHYFSISYKTINFDISRFIQGQYFTLLQTNKDLLLEFQDALNVLYDQFSKRSELGQPSFDTYSSLYSLEFFALFSGPSPERERIEFIKNDVHFKFFKEFLFEIFTIYMVLFEIDFLSRNNENDKKFMQDVFTTQVKKELENKIVQYIKSDFYNEENMQFLFLRLYSYAIELIILYETKGFKHISECETIAHYTSLMNFEKILKNNELLLNLNTSLNDLNEGKTLWKTSDIVRVCSMTQEIDSMALWGNYTDNSGVAIVFDKARIEKSLSTFVTVDDDNMIRISKFTASNVVYGKEKSQNVVDIFRKFIEGLSWIPDSIKEINDEAISKGKEHNSFFFKDNNWKYEKEFRFIVTSKEYDDLTEQWNKNGYNSYRIDDKNLLFNTFLLSDIKKILLSPKLSKSEIVVAGIKEFVSKINPNIEVECTTSNLKI